MTPPPRISPNLKDLRIEKGILDRAEKRSDDHVVPTDLAARCRT